CVRSAASLLPQAGPIVGALPVLALWSVVRARASHLPSVWLVAALPWITGLVVLLDAIVFEPLGLRWLPSDRLLDAVWLAVVLAGTLGGAGIHGEALPYGWPRWLKRHEDLQAGLAVTLFILVLTLGDPTVTLWPGGGLWPAYADAARGLRMETLWRALRNAPPGRVLFVRSGVPLVYGTDWWRPHTHITALTPHASGREIVNGTFTHSSPVAALVYRGDAGRGAITTLVERLDGVSLFGRPLESLDAATLNEQARRLRVSTIVAIEDDLPRLPALADNPTFPTRRLLPPFVVWTGERALVPQAIGPGRWRAIVDGAPGEWASAGLTYYPLWRASSLGRALERRRGAAGDLEVRAPATA